MKNDYQNIKNTTIILAIILAAGLYGVYFWYNRIVEASKEIQADKITFKTELLNAQGTVQIKNKIAQLTQIEEYFAQMYVQSDNVVEFIEYFESLGRETGLDLEILNFNIEDGEGVGQKVTLSVSALGSWNNVNSFVLAIEKSPYHLVINNLRLSSDGSVWQVRMNLESLTN
jgi:Tfp pilus assembly protein PilO